MLDECLCLLALVNKESNGQNIKFIGINREQQIASKKV
jgi:hypothetical protein